MKVIEMAFAGYPVTDVKRARDFYEGVLGLEPASIFGGEKMAWIEYEIGPSTLAIGYVANSVVADSLSAWKPTGSGGTVALEVDDFDSAIEHLKENNVQFRNEPAETPVCHMATITDPDGNPIVIHKRKG